MVSIIAKNLKDRRQYAALSAIFSEADVSGDGKISVAEYMGILDEYGVQIPDEEIDHIVKLADAGGNFSLKDFVQYVKTSKTFKTFEEVDDASSVYMQKKVDLAFGLIDKNKDGFLTEEEYRSMTSSRRIKPRHIHLMFERCDLNGDGKLDKEEFTRLIDKNRVKKEEEQRRVEELKLLGPRALYKADMDDKFCIDSFIFSRESMLESEIRDTEEVEEEIDIEDGEDGDDEADIEEEVEEEDVSSDFGEWREEGIRFVTEDDIPEQEIQEELVEEEDEGKDSGVEESIEEDLDQFYEQNQ